MEAVGILRSPPGQIHHFKARTVIRACPYVRTARDHDKS